MNKQNSIWPLALCMLCLICTNARAENRPTPDKSPTPTIAVHPALAELEARLKPIILAAQPDAFVRAEGNSLFAQYHVQNHIGVSTMSGGTIQAKEENGPRENGIQLEISIKHLSVDPVLIPTALTVQWPLWSTYFKRYHLGQLSAPSKPGRVDQTLAMQGTVAYVDNERDHWAYEAMGTLTKSNWLRGHNQQFDARKAATRYDFAVATVYLQRNLPLVEKERLVFTPENEVEARRHPSAATSGWAPIGCAIGAEGPRDPQLPPTIQQLKDATSALMREFQDEIALLGGPIPSTVAEAIMAPGAHKQPSLWLSLSYGAKADTKLIEQIKQTVAAYAEQRIKAQQ